MNSNGLVEKHWLRVAVLLLADMAIVVVAFVLATLLVDDPSFWAERILWRMPTVILGGTFLGCTCYVLGIYQKSRRGAIDQKRRFRHTSALLIIALTVAMVSMLLLGTLDHSIRLGKMQGAVGFALGYALLIINYFLRIRQQYANQKERLAFVVTSAEDESRLSLFKHLHNIHFHMAGIIIVDDYHIKDPEFRVIGKASELLQLAEANNLSRIICTDDGLVNPGLRDKVCQLRYSGMTVISLLSLCEEIYQCVPLPLVSPQWLLNASGSPQMEYIRKFKRIVDLVCAMIGVVLLGPLMVFGMVLVKLSSPGPIIFRQRRSGQLGREFDVLKLRTMTVDAEKHGAQWAVANDPRVTRIGHYLRKYRIDELPQLINVIRGEMSFIGPRPERPEFIETLAADVPYFQERLMVRPGLTGWAQVNYPYGSTVEDARRKLEFDLYYLKHMGVFLDMLILLDTFRIVLKGSLWGNQPEDVSKLVDPALAEGAQSASDESVVPAGKEAAAVL